MYSSRTAPRGRFHVGIWYNFADEPVEDVVDHVHSIDLVGSYSLLDWLELGIDAPFSDVKSSLAGTRSDTG